MPRLFIACMMMLMFCGAAEAAVELALEGHPPVTINEVYHRNGVVFLAVEDVLPPLGLSGQWDSVDHVYRIKSPRGVAVISPGSQFMRHGDLFRPLNNPPRFMDGRLRVDASFISLQLPALVGGSIYFRDLNPGTVAEQPDGSPIDRLFAFLLRKDKPDDAPVLRGIAIDPGHGGQDPGSMAADGLKEKDVTLDVALRLEKQLKMHLGIPVYLTRDSDYTVQETKRLAAVNQPDVDALVLLHAQGSFSEASRGTTLFVRSAGQQPAGTPAGQAGDSMRLARHLAASLKRAGIRVNGIERAPLLPLGRGDLPSVLVELGYLSNPSDLAFLRDDGSREKLAEALFLGLQQFADENREVEG